MLKKILALFNPAPAEQAIKKGRGKKKKRVEAARIGELGEHKINIQLDQLPKDCRYLSDLLIRNPKSRTGYSQIDHVVLSPYGVFVIETKNYNGEIKGTRADTNWTVSNRFKMYNPIKQNYGHIKAVESHLVPYRSLRYISMISFTMRCRFSIDPELRKIQSDELIVYDVELTEFISRKLIRMKAERPEVPLSAEDVARIHGLLRNANIVDAAVRAEHIQKATK